MENLKQHILKYIALTNEEMKDVIGYFTPLSFKRKEIILNAGAICKYDYYVVSGALKLSQINQQTGTEEILSLAIKDWWITDLDSLRNRTPSKGIIAAEQDTEVLCIDNVRFEQMCTSIPQMERYFRLMTEKHLVSWMNRIYMRNTLSAEERFDHFTQMYPELYEVFPRYLIASYLGMSAEMLSKIRSRKQ